MSIKITDISHWAGKDIDPQEMKSAGVAGIIFKASQNYKDDCYDFFVDLFAGVLPHGAYHYYDNNKDPNDQAELFINSIDSDVRFLVADYEDPYEGKHSGWSKLSTFLTKVEEARPDLKIIVYSTYWYWLANSPQGWWQTLQLNWFSRYKFWLAAYNSRPFADQLIPKPWAHKDTLMHQFTVYSPASDFGVYSALDVDLNNWTGTQEEFAEYFGEVTEIPPVIEPPPETETPPQYECVVRKEIYKLNVRSEPNASSWTNKIGYLYSGDYFFGGEIVPEPANQAEWMQIVDEDGEELGWCAAVWKNVPYVDYDPIAPQPPIIGDDEMIAESNYEIARQIGRVADAISAGGGITPPPVSEYPKIRHIFPQEINGIAPMLRTPDTQTDDNKYKVNPLVGTQILEYAPPQTVYQDGGTTIWRTAADLENVLEGWACVLLDQVVVNVGGVSKMLYEYPRNNPDGAPFGAYGFIERKYIK